VANSSQVELIAIDDDPFVLTFAENVLAQPGLNISRFNDSMQGWEAIRRIRPDIVLLDQNVADANGRDLFSRILEFDPGIQVVILTGNQSTDSAVAAIQNGASDYLTKPIVPATLRSRVDRLVRAAQNRGRAPEIDRELMDASPFAALIGRGASMVDVYARVRRIAPHFRSVLIAGATGTGKELVARGLHQMSPLKDKPFVVCNCAAITDTLFESELFGHVRGSFTGATQDRVGFFEAADGGTLFLDEIGEVPLKMQAKFLRALQSGEIQRVGSSVMRRVNLRVIAATNRNLHEMVRQGEFREDLFYRLAMLEINLPSLVDRKEDMPSLWRYFVDRFSRQTNKEIRGVTRRAQTVLLRHSWPGNIRELENVIGHACMMAEGDLIDICDLPEQLIGRIDSPERQDQLTLGEVENRHVRYILEQTGGNKQLAAEILGISRATLYRFLSTKECEPIVREIA
jgi:DNA-binding NtrC family response regulator